MERNTGSLAMRAVLALALMVGFYLLALGIAATLIALPILEVVYAGRLHFKLAFVAIAGGGVILWSVIPRPDRFEPPGPRLEPGKNPELFRTLHAIARTAGQEMPAEVYAVSDVNAFVTERGGIMGFGSRRVMGLGLPLMQALDVAEFRAVLSHEFGHFHGGDTKLGPWIYKTRAAIGRTIGNLRQAESSVLHKPFEWYGAVFLRITHAISRAQEYAADALAARVVGPGPLASGLRKVGGAAAAFDGYWEDELGPALNGGFRVPMMAGFASFLNRPRVQGALDELLQRRMQESGADPYDTHPPLPDRLAALGELPGDEERSGADAEPAITLLGDVDAVERALLAFMTGDAQVVSSLREASWDDLVQLHFLPMWRKAAADLEQAGRTETFAELPELLAKARPVAAKLYGESVMTAPEEAVRGAVAGKYGAALAATLADSGWTAVVEVGEAPRLVRGDATLEPFALAGRLAAGELKAEEWRALAEEHDFGARVPRAAADGA